MMENESRGVVYHLSLVTRSGPPKDHWIFLLKNGLHSKRFKIPTDCELWLEHIVRVGYQKIGGIGRGTVIPDSELVSLFS